MLTIAYQTSRKNPRIEWFLESLWHQWDKTTPIKVVVVDFHRDSRFAWLESKWAEAGVRSIWTTPKPNVWQGKHRLTTKDYFAASNARNTALCYAEDGYIAYVDDLSVLLPGWFQQVKEAMEGGWIACGAYAKVKELVVENGAVQSFLGVTGEFDATREKVIANVNAGFPGGLDSRIKYPPNDDPYPCSGSWMFGASVAMPVEALLNINGWDEDADGMSGEDYICGLMLERAGYQLKYCRRMMTLESEEAHYEDTPMVRVIKGPPGKTDASHRLLNWVLSGGRNKAPNYFGDGGIRALRKKVLAGEPFPIMRVPEHHWYDGQPLREM